MVGSTARLCFSDVAVREAAAATAVVSGTMLLRNCCQESLRVCAELLQLCPTLCSPKACSLPGSSMENQARILEWVATPSSEGPSRPRDSARISLHLLLWQAHSLSLLPPGSFIKKAYWVPLQKRELMRHSENT